MAKKPVTPYTTFTGVWFAFICTMEIKKFLLESSGAELLLASPVGELLLNLNLYIFIADLVCAM